MKFATCFLVFLALVGFSYAENTVPTNSKLYYDLPLSQSQEKDIYKLITTLANTSTFGLMFKKSELEDIGKRIYGVHPLRYIGFIYAVAELKQAMPKLLNKSIVASRFVKELSSGLNQKLSDGELKQYMPGFADALHLEVASLMNFIDTSNWDGLLEYLNLH